MSALADRLRGWVKDKAEHYTYRHFPNPAAEVDPLLPYGSYFRLSLAQMFLSTRREWFTELYPAAHTSVRIQHADYEAVELSHVTHVPGSDLAKGIDLNSAVTGLIPYNGGTLDIDCGLVALHDDAPVGWCAMAPRPAYAGLLRVFKVPWEGRDEDRDDPTVWAVTCLFTRAGFRKRGVSRALAARAQQSRPIAPEAVE